MANPFDPNTGTSVTKAEATAWIEKYDSEMRPDKDVDTRSVFFGKDVLTKMLEGKSAGITFFLGLKYSDFAKKDVVNLVLVPTTDDGTLLWDGATPSAKADGDSAYDVGSPCPPYCTK